MTATPPSARFEPVPTRAGQRLAGKTALVTGGGGTEPVLNIGRAIARLLAAEGATVAVMDRDSAAADHALAEIALDGGNGCKVVGDVTVAADCERVVGEVRDRAGCIDVLVNNVAIAAGQTLLELDEAFYDTMMAVNVKGAVLMSKHAVPAMPPGSSIVNISSIAAERPGAGTAYGVSKAALEGLTRALAIQLGSRGIRANCVRPGSVWSALVARGIPEERIQAVRSARAEFTLVGTEGTAWDVAEAVAFLASDAAAWITGQVLTVDGGSLLRDDRPGRRTPQGS